MARMVSARDLADVASLVASAAAIRDPAELIAFAVRGLGTLVPAGAVRPGVPGGPLVSIDPGVRNVDSRERAIVEAVVPALGALYERLNGRVAEALSAREREVVGWVARGETNPVVARRLGISPRTVQRHLDHVYAKLGVGSRTAAALALYGFSIPSSPHRSP